jgi:hypothetical protein
VALVPPQVRYLWCTIYILLLEPTNWLPTTNLLEPTNRRTNRPNQPMNQLTNQQPEQPNVPLDTVEPLLLVTFFFNALSPHRFKGCSTRCSLNDLSSVGLLEKEPLDVTAIGGIRSPSMLVNRPLYLVGTPSGTSSVTCTAHYEWLPAEEARRRAAECLNAKVDFVFSCCCDVPPLTPNVYTHLHFRHFSPLEDRKIRQMALIGCWKKTRAAAAAAADLFLAGGTREGAPRRSKRASPFVVSVAAAHVATTPMHTHTHGHTHLPPARRLNWLTPISSA